VKKQKNQIRQGVSTMKKIYSHVQEGKVLRAGSESSHECLGWLQARMAGSQILGFAWNGAGCLQAAEWLEVPVEAQARF
jgi:hypothetical protein